MNMSTQKETHRIVLVALGIVLVAITTLLIRIPNGLQGYVNVGDAVIFIFAVLVDPVDALLIGGIGSAIADIAGGYAYYAIFTLIIKGIEGYVASRLYKQWNRGWLAFLIAAIWMIGGYLIADSIVNQSFWLGLASVTGNLVQGGASVIIATALEPAIKKAAIRRFSF